MHHESESKVAKKPAQLLEWMLYSPVSIPVLSLLLSLLIVSIMALFYRVQPWAILVALFEGGLKGNYALASTIKETVPLALAGLAVFIPFRAGFFNIGGQGQLEIGALAAMFVVLTVQGPPLFVILLAMLAAMATGALATVVPLLFKLKRNASEVTTTIMMNFTCIFFVSAMITGVMKDPEAYYATTPPAPAIYRLPALPLGIDINIGIFLTIGIVIAVYFWMKHTPFGVELSAVGYNPNAARTAGISVTKVIIIAVLGGAMLAGLAGGLQALGVTHRVASGWAKGWGFTGISIAFLAGNNPIAIIPIAFLLAILETGARYMQAMTGVPAALIYVFQGLPVLIYVSLRAWSAIKPKKVDQPGGSGKAADEKTI